MVSSKNGKRIREGAPLVVHATDLPKRTRKNAKRKVLKGQEISQKNKPIENNEPPPELWPNLHIQPEDFITFLCFRGTLSLPQLITKEAEQQKNIMEIDDSYVLL